MALERPKQVNGVGIAFHNKLTDLSLEHLPTCPPQKRKQNQVQPSLSRTFFHQQQKMNHQKTYLARKTIQQIISKVFAITHLHAKFILMSFIQKAME